MAKLRLVVVWSVPALNDTMPLRFIASARDVVQMAFRLSH
ncbi:hypothetical protein AEST_31360 [Alishewanella aestuarii B11]|uniref:Uncharacterized protein n=1 Tax=Alishewanella aestuarii B11 TaxID=1197174 RepID=J1Y893_9ALTE|nr:hypothetical protein AEST_31360 [Alishewanella aestuarii B11]